jgi:hypothetical protein
MDSEQNRRKNQRPTSTVRRLKFSQQVPKKQKKIKQSKMKKCP